jgi:hypothetical protein
VPAFTELRSPAVAAELVRLKKRFRKIERDFEAGLEELRRAPVWLGDIIPGYAPHTRKLRMGIKSANISKRDGLRLVYRPIPPRSDGVLTLLLYYKPDSPDFVFEELKRALSLVRPQVEQALVDAGMTPTQIDDLFTP